MQPGNHGAEIIERQPVHIADGDGDSLAIGLRRLAEFREQLRHIEAHHTAVGNARLGLTERHRLRRQAMGALEAVEHAPRHPVLRQLLKHLFGCTGNALHERRLPVSAVERQQDRAACRGGGGDLCQHLPSRRCLVGERDQAAPVTAIAGADHGDVDSVLQG